MRGPVIETLKVGDRVLVNERKEGVIVALAEIQVPDTSPQRPFIKVEFKTWWGGTKREWHPCYRVGVFKSVVEATS